MKTTKLLINILIILLIAVALWLGWRFFFGAEPEPAPTLSTETATGDSADSLADGTGSEFVLLLARLRNVTLDDSFLTNPTFTSGLTDFSTDLPARSYGRNNPFAPFGVGNVSRGSTAGGNSSVSPAGETNAESTTDTAEPQPDDLSDQERDSLLDSLRGN